MKEVYLVFFRRDAYSVLYAIFTTLEGAATYAGIASRPAGDGYMSVERWTVGATPEIPRLVHTCDGIRPQGADDDSPTWREDAAL